jgi:hypothetical protein
MSELLSRLGANVLLRPEELMKLIRSAPRRYKVYEIPKKTEGQMRTIAQPAREVKALQYWAMKEVLSELSIHDAATAYRTGQSIADNASRHVASRFLLKMDFENFFPSLRDTDWRSHVGTTYLIPKWNWKRSAVFYSGNPEEKRACVSPSEPLAHRYYQIFYFTSSTID